MSDSRLIWPCRIQYEYHTICAQ